MKLIINKEWSLCLTCSQLKFSAKIWIMEKYCLVNRLRASVAFVVRLFQLYQLNLQVSKMSWQSCTIYYFTHLDNPRISANVCITWMMFDEVFPLDLLRINSSWFELQLLIKFKFIFSLAPSIYRLYLTFKSERVDMETIIKHFNLQSAPLVWHF